MGSIWFLPGIYNDLKKKPFIQGIQGFSSGRYFGNPHGFGTESIKEFYKGSIRGFYKVSIGDS